MCWNGRIGTLSGQLSFPDSAVWLLLIASIRALCRFGVYPVYPAIDLEGSREGSLVRRMGSEICGERNSSLVFTEREPRSNVEWHSVLQTKSRDEKWDPWDHLSQLPVEESGGADPIVRGTRIWRPDRDIAVRIIAFFFFLILFHPC